MGRTIAPYRWIYEEEKNYWYKRLKKSSYLKEGKELFTGGAYYNDAGSNWGTGLVRDKALLLVLFAQYKELNKLEEKFTKIQYHRRNKGIIGESGGGR